MRDLKQVQKGNSYRNKMNTMNYSLGNQCWCSKPFDDIQIHKEPDIFFSNPVISKNKIVGVFTYGSSQYLFYVVIWRSELVAVDSGEHNQNKPPKNALASVDYLFIEKLLEGKKIEEALNYAQNAFGMSKFRNLDAGDSLKRLTSFRQWFFKHL